MEAEKSSAVLAMYDIRGIQSYIFRTPKLQDAMGSSRLVDEIILYALRDGCEAVKKAGRSELKTYLDWENHESLQSGAEPADSDYVEPVYIGGGNGVVIFSSQKLAQDVNKHMSLYVLEHTYTLQLAIAMVNKTESYEKDYDNLNAAMTRTKETMEKSRPLGTLPISRTELRTGLPVYTIRENREMSRETYEKKIMAGQLKDGKNPDAALHDSYVTEKGIDSTIAVVHADGNNMGLRIRKLLQNVETYGEAVPRMRKISKSISKSYTSAFKEMAEKFNKAAAEQGKYYVRPILVGGDDITYVCNGRIAIETVRTLVRELAGSVLFAEDIQHPSEDELREYGLNICAGIAYAHSHFPFHIAYDVAESCCGSAKERAKKPECRDGEMIGNWVDFAICRNIHTQNLSRVRKEQYRTASGENLLKRPYYIETGVPALDKGFEKESVTRYSINTLIDDIRYFTKAKDGSGKGTDPEEKAFPVSFAKQLRNAYPYGKMGTDALMAFLKSRNLMLPREAPLFSEDGTAEYYDALEMMDLYAELKEEEAQEDETGETGNQAGQ